MVLIQSRSRVPRPDLHTELLSLSEVKDCYAFLAKGNGAKKLLIFVHGFNGSAIGTWGDFPNLLRNHPSTDQTDIIFYGYSSLEFQAADHANDFYHFLREEIEGSKKSLIKKYTANNNLFTREYESTVVVAHSLGAIIVREALHSAYLDKKSWLSNVKMCLFAPAHKGAHILPLLKQVISLNLIGKLCGVIANYKIPVLKDLSEDSYMVKKIWSETEVLQKTAEGDFTKAKLVIHAKGDKIVNNVRYLHDSDTQGMENRTHSTVCKPDATRQAELELLIDLLK